MVGVVVVTTTNLIPLAQGAAIVAITDLMRTADLSPRRPPATTTAVAPVAVPEISWRDTIQEEAAPTRPIRGIAADMRRVGRIARLRIRAAMTEGTRSGIE